ncbi:toll/interleukin-1 receptor domain-containing protein [Thiomonas sp.]
MQNYHVALSFAGEDRDYVEKVAVNLKAAGVEVFYDLFEEADLWGKDLYAHLSGVYQKKAVYTVIFVSTAYRDKLWTNHERRSAQARAFSESSEYILPALFDKTVEIPGLLKTTGNIDLTKKTPEQLADLIVEKLVRSGVTLSKRFAYSDSAIADADFAAPRGSTVETLIQEMRSYTWPTQRPAVERLLAMDLTKLSVDEFFVLGRNLYQCACGNELKAVSVMTNLRRELAKLNDEEAALHLLNGMLFEVYFDKNGEFRGRQLKARYLPELLAVQPVKKYAPFIMFIRRALEPYRASLAFLPNTVPEKVEVRLRVRRSDPPTVTSMKVGEQQLLQGRSADDEDGGPFWRFHHSGFTIGELGAQMTREWGVPSSHLSITATPKTDEHAKLRLAENTRIGWPGDD